MEELMHKRGLYDVQDWPGLARKNAYRLKHMAQELKLSVRWLEVWVEGKYGANAHALLSDWRAAEIRALAQASLSGVQIAKAVGFANLPNLCRFLVPASMSVKIILSVNEKE